MLKRQRKHRQKRRAEGKCEREGCLESPGAAYYCPTHKRDRRERARKARSGSLKRGPGWAPKDPRIRNARERKVIKELGLCAWMGCRFARVTTVHCDIHREIVNRHARERYQAVGS